MACIQSTSSRFGIVLARVRAPALVAGQGRAHRRLGAVEQIAQLERLGEVGVVAAALVVDEQVRAALA